MMVKKLVMVILFLSIQTIGAMLKPASCSAAIVEMSVSGRIVVIDPLLLLPPDVHTGEPWSGTIRWETDIPDDDADPKHGHYFDDTRPDALSITVNVHGHVFAGGFGELSAHVYNDWPPMPGEPIQFAPGDSFIFGGPMRQSPSLLDLSGIGFSWNDSTGRAFAGDELPLAFDPFLFTQNDGSVVVPSYSPIHIKIFDIGLATPTHVIQYDVFAAIETAEFRVVPEPRSLELLLACASIAALICIVRLAVPWLIKKRCARRVRTNTRSFFWSREDRHVVILENVTPGPLVSQAP
jgi:hypothetical protein